MAKSRKEPFADLVSIIKGVKKTALSELSLEVEGRKIKLKRDPLVQPAPPVIEVTSPSPPPPPAEKREEEENLEKIFSPMVGIFTLGNLQEQDLVGREFDKGKTLCVIESMRIKNGIKSELKCRIVDILVKDREPVEYGQPLFLVEPL